MSILVTGSAGYIAGNIIRILYQRGEKAIGFDLGRVGPQSVLWDIRDKLELVPGSVVDLSHLMRVAKDYKVEGIIHTASLIGDPANQRPVDAVRIIVEGTVNVLETVRILGLRRAVCCSSGSAAGAYTDLNKHVKEEDPPLVPQSGIYPVLKLATEGICHNYQALFGVSAIAVRPSRIYGPGAPPMQGGYGQMPVEYLVDEAVNGRSVNLESGADTPVDYTYSKDEAEGIIRAFTAKSPRYSLYNLSSGDVRSPVQIAAALKQLFPELTFNIGPGIWPGWLPKAELKGAVYQTAVRSPFDVSRAKADLGYQPHDLDKAIPDYIRWIRNKEYTLPERM